MEIRHHQRKNIRLKDYDYSQPGGYFVTICTHDKFPFFGTMVQDKMQLSQQGLIAQQCWNEIPNHVPNVFLDECIVMPDHIHGIIIITDKFNTTNGRDLIHQIPLQNNIPIQNNIPTKQIPNADVMNHVPTEWGLMKNPKMTLGKIVRSYKARSTKFIHDAGYSDFQ